MADIVALGEALIDFVAGEAEVSLMDAKTFVKAAGGAPANLACAAARLGISSALIAKVGDDPFGRFLERTFADAGTDTSRMVFDPNYHTTLAFVALLPGMVPDFTFYRNPSADLMLQASELDRDFLKAAKVFCYGSLSLISEPSRSATFAAIEAAREGRAIISYDPNLRPALWKDLDEARTGILQGMQHANILKLSTEELEFVTGEPDRDKACRVLFDGHRDLRLILATMGPDGCYFNNRSVSGRVPGFKVDVVDTTGAGDAFAAAALVEILLRGWRLSDLSQLPGEDLKDICRFANAVAALTTTKKGAIEALPTRADAHRLIEG
ncbi:MAG: PfkB family carbohydrate kinase [Armatimonadota bacterium]|nr:PfkB family carbohydrate kinase [Armatimonadota bacterium]